MKIWLKNIFIIIIVVEFKTLIYCKTSLASYLNQVFVHINTFYLI